MFVSVDLPIPGEPPSSTSEPGTRPPPSTRSSSPMPVDRRCTRRRADVAQRTRGERRAPRAPPRAAPPRRAALGRAVPPRAPARARRRQALLDERVPGVAAGALAVPLRRLQRRTREQTVDGRREPSRPDYGPAGTAQPRPCSARAARDGRRLLGGRRRPASSSAARPSPSVSSSGGAAFGADADRRLLLLRLDDRQAHLALVVALGRGVDDDGRARRELLAQHEVGERVLDVALDRAAQRARAHRRVPALLDEQVLGLARSARAAARARPSTRGSAAAAARRSA